MDNVDWPYFFETALTNNDIVGLETMLDNNIDLNTVFCKTDLYWSKCNFATFLFLEKNGVGLSDRINDIGKLMVKQNNLIGINYCLQNDASIDYLFQQSIKYCNCDLVKYFLQNGADIFSVTKSDIQNLTDNNKDDLDIIILLVEHGYDILPDIKYLAVRTILYDKINILKYFVSIGLDINYDNSKLLICATERSRKIITEYLLENGADIKAPNILNFYEKIHGPPSKLDVTLNRFFTDDVMENFLLIFKLLIKYGATTNNIENTFISYVFLYGNKIDEELFIWFLDNGLRICNKQLLELIMEYQRTDVAILCFKNGIILDITDDLVCLTIAKNDIKLKEILADLGSNIYDIENEAFGKK